jgi:methylmalonyl-CoA mutase
MEENGFKKAKELTNQFSKQEGRQPRIMITNLGDVDHDKDVKKRASEFADLGFDVDICPPSHNPRALAKQAVENDVHYILFSYKSSSDIDLVSKIVKELKSFESGDIGIAIAIGGQVQQKEYELLIKAGATVIFEQNSKIYDAAIHMFELL